MSGAELWGVLGHVLETAKEFFSGGWDAPKVLQAVGACFTIASGTFGIVQAIRFADRHLISRIHAYLKREEDRLADARSRILTAIRKEPPGKPSPKPLFSNKELSKVLRGLRFGKLDQAEGEITKALALIDDKVDAANDLADAHNRQKALALLTLGAIADAKGQHAIALGHFIGVLEIDPDDADALEYAGKQDLKLANPQGALDYFGRLQQAAARLGDDLLVARSKRLQAEARLSFPVPQYGLANQLLLQIVGLLPTAMGTLERANIHELHGRVRKGAGNPGVSLSSFQNALIAYSQVHAQHPKDQEAQDGIARATREIAALNDDNASAQPQAQLNTSPTTISGVPIALPPPNGRSHN